MGDMPNLDGFRDNLFPGDDDRGPGYHHALPPTLPQPAQLQVSLELARVDILAILILTSNYKLIFSY